MASRFLSPRPRATRSPAVSFLRVSSKIVPRKNGLIAVLSQPKSTGAPIKVVSSWSPDSWKSANHSQFPVYHYSNEEEFHSVLRSIESFPPMVVSAETRTLQKRIADASIGKTFLLHVGDFAERLEGFSLATDTFRVQLQMGAVLNYDAHMPVIKVCKMVSQIDQPRSDPFEAKDGVTLPSFQANNINSNVFDEKYRAYDPQMLYNAYFQNASTSNSLRGLATGGYADIHRVKEWSLDFTKHGEQGQRYMKTALGIEKAVSFMEAAGLTVDPIKTETEFWMSHECLHLPYEQALTREDSTSGLYYDCSAHMLWLGEKTKQLDGPHVEFLRGVTNPLGIKVGYKTDPKELVKLCEILNPSNKPGRLTILIQMGAEATRMKLPLLIGAVRQAELLVTWVSAPMHGFSMTPSGRKTRSFNAIKSKLMAFFDVHEQEGSYPGGIHIETTGQDVKECIVGSWTVASDDLNSLYPIDCDPRLNASQALELAFDTAARLRTRRSGNGFVRTRSEGH